MNLLSIDTLVECLISSGDESLREMAKKELTEIIGDETIITEFQTVFFNPKRTTYRLKQCKLLSFIKKDTRRYISRKKWKTESYHMSYDAIIELSDMNELKALYQLQFTSELYLNNLIKKLYPTFYNSDKREVFYNSAFCGIMEAYSKKTLYRNEKAKFATFARPYIMHQLMDQNNFETNYKNIYFKSLSKKIEAVICELEKENSPVTVEKVSEITGFSKKIVSREMKILSSAGDLSYNQETYFEKEGKSTEDCFIERENSRILSEMLNELEAEMREIVIKRAAEKKSFMRIATEMNVEESYVQKKYNSGIKLLRKSEKAKFLNY